MTADYLAEVVARANAATEGPVVPGSYTALYREDVLRLVALVREAEAERDAWLRSAATLGNKAADMEAERDSARAALAALVADLRVFAAADTGMVDLRALADRYDDGAS